MRSAMKLFQKLLSLVLLFVTFGWCCITAHGQGETYYYKQGKRIPLTIDQTKTFVLFSSETTRNEIEEATKPSRAVLKAFDAVTKPKGLEMNVNARVEDAKWAIIENEDISARPLDNAAIREDVLYQAPFVVTEDKKQVGMSHLLYVKLHKPEDEEKLIAKAKELGVEVVGNNELMPLWYTLSCGKETTGNSLEVANKLFETELFAAAEPDFLADFQIKQSAIKRAKSNDAHFTDQWGLKNTGQHGGTAGMDIGIEDAWKVSTGKGVKVAVVDHGIELDHPDLVNNISADSYDTVSGTSPSQVHGSHGTACAGIIGAMTNNSGLGVAGVAPDATLMSVSDTLRLGPGAQQRLANGIMWAVQNGADVISNSWGHDLLASPLIDDAINEALTNGRGGKGCVVVFAAGNNDGTIIYPGNSNPLILAVAAMSPCGERKSPLSCDPETFWGSCYGSQLDVAAPGVLIPTTDRTGTDGYVIGDYTLTFNGTSSATPHVAGVAALILQVNPDLTQQQVVTIIEKSARKVGPYSYAPTSGRPNGDYHEEMGYGLVNAAVCVNAVKPAVAGPASGKAKGQ